MIFSILLGSIVGLSITGLNCFYICHDNLLELSVSHQVQLLIYFMLKYAMEIVLAESSLITGYYFIWSTSSVAIFLACLGLTVLPVNVLIGSYVSNIFEER